MPAPKKTSRARSKAKANGPSEIAPDVFVGGWNDALGFAGAKFCVLDDAPHDMPAATHVPIYNEARDQADTANLGRLVRSIRAARTEGKPVLVFCGHGARRSPLGGAWYLHTSEGISLDAAYDRIRAVRPNVEHACEWIGDCSNLESG